MIDRSTVFARVSAAVAEVMTGRKIDVRAEHHLVDDLGLDSTSIASLTIALEEQFGEILLLNDWIAAAHSPSDLTIESLVQYLMGILSEDG